MRPQAGFVWRAVAAALFALSLAPSARAALFDDEEARKRIEATNQRLAQTQREFDERIAALESQLKSQGLVELFNQVELLKADAARLRGQMEVLSYELAEAQKRQRDLYVDLDSRLRRMESAPTAGAPNMGDNSPTSPPLGAVVPGTPGAGSPATSPSTATSPSYAMPAPPAAPPARPPTTIMPPVPVAPSTFGPPGAAPPAAVATPPAGGQGPPIVLQGRAVPVPAPADVQTEQRAYDAALDLFKTGNYNGAISAFSAFVRTYPRSPLAPSAQYWLGNAQFAQRDYRGAIQTQRQLMSIYPDSQKVPDALLNIATSQFELGDAGSSRRTLEDLIARYPQSEAATKARQRLAIR